MSGPGTGSQASQGVAKGIPDLVGPALRVLFCGINPGQRSGELGLHFARPGNRFWKLLYAGGFTDHVFAPSEQHALPALGVGITNLVERVTVAASEGRKAPLDEVWHLLMEVRAAWFALPAAARMKTGRLSATALQTWSPGSCSMVPIQ